MYMKSMKQYINYVRENSIRSVTNVGILWTMEKDGNILSRLKFRFHALGIERIDSWESYLFVIWLHVLEDE